MFRSRSGAVRTPKAMSLHTVTQPLEDSLRRRTPDGARLGQSASHRPASETLHHCRHMVRGRSCPAIGTRPRHCLPATPVLSASDVQNTAHHPSRANARARP